MKILDKKYFEIQYPSYWTYLYDEEANLHCLCKDSEKAYGALQISVFISDSNTFNVQEEFRKYEKSSIIEINGYSAVYFVNSKINSNIYNWLTGNEGVMLYLTYTVAKINRTNDELDDVQQILKTLKIK